MKRDYICIHNARVAQLVEHDLAKVGVAGSSLVSRSKIPQKEGFLVEISLSNCFFEEELIPKSKIRHSKLTSPGGGTGRHAGLKILWPLRPYRFDSDPGYM